MFVNKGLFVGKLIEGSTNSVPPNGNQSDIVLKAEDPTHKEMLQGDQRNGKTSSSVAVDHADSSSSKPNTSSIAQMPSSRIENDIESSKDLAEMVRSRNKMAWKTPSVPAVVD